MVSRGQRRFWHSQLLCLLSMEAAAHRVMASLGGNEMRISNVRLGDMVGDDVRSTVGR